MARAICRVRHHHQLGAGGAKHSQSAGRNHNRPPRKGAPLHQYRGSPSAGCTGTSGMSMIASGVCERRCSPFAHFDHFQENIGRGLPNHCRSRAGGRFLYRKQYVDDPPFHLPGNPLVEPFTGPRQELPSLPFGTGTAAGGPRVSSISGSGQHV
jgi:hypothetical protein